MWNDILNAVGCLSLIILPIMVISVVKIIKDERAYEKLRIEQEMLALQKQQEEEYRRLYLMNFIASSK